MYDALSYTYVHLLILISYVKNILHNEMMRETECRQHMDKKSGEGQNKRKTRNKFKRKKTGRTRNNRDKTSKWAIQIYA